LEWTLLAMTTVIGNLGFSAIAQGKNDARLNPFERKITLARG